MRKTMIQCECGYFAENYTEWWKHNKRTKCFSGTDIFNEDYFALHKRGGEINE